MKTKAEILREVFKKHNLKSIPGELGNLLAYITDDAMQLYAEQAIERCSEVADAKVYAYDNDDPGYEINTESILAVKEELK